MANYSGQISDTTDDGLTFLLNGGHGRFRLGARVLTGRGSVDAAMGDVNGDGYADAVTGNLGSADISVAFGRPDGLSASRTTRVPCRGRVQRVLLPDFDGDGRGDAVTANTGSHSVSILLTR